MSDHSANAVPVRVPFPVVRSLHPGLANLEASIASHPANAGVGFTIDCADCDYRGTAVCDDCVVSFIVDREPNDAIIVDANEARAVRLLENVGLVPGVRHSRQVS